MQIIISPSQLTWITRISLCFTLTTPTPRLMSGTATVMDIDTDQQTDRKIRTADLCDLEGIDIYVEIRRYLVKGTFVPLSLIERAILNTNPNILYIRPSATSIVHQFKVDGDHISCPKSHRRRHWRYVRAIFIEPGLVVLLLCPYTDEFGHIAIITSEGMTVSVAEYSLRQLVADSDGVFFKQSKAQKRKKERRKFIYLFGDPLETTFLIHEGFVRA